MARKEKVIEKTLEIDDNIDRREVGYYSTPEFISDYISSRMMQINNKGVAVLDPCCGKEELLSRFIDSGFSVDGIDIIKYKDTYTCNFKKLDFIQYYCDRKDKKNEQISILDTDSDTNFQLQYDYYIANPPYNCHEVDYIKNNKSRLKKYFNDVGVYNMYGMFISAIIDLAKTGSLIGLITFDSFLTLKYYEGLRRKILNNCTIHEITMCPTDLFLNQSADVRTSIIILQKSNKNQNNIIVNNRTSNVNDFKKVLQNNVNGCYKKYSLNDIILKNKKDNLEFLIECPDDVKILFNEKRLGDVFKCVTGISTGNDKKYLSDKKEGDFTIPFYKNPGNDRFYTNKFIYLHKDFLKLDKEIKNFMVRNKSLLYKPGISCSSMGVEFTASRLPENSTYGVNPNIICKDSDTWWLMAYLNSSLVTYLVRGVLIRSNMITSGYVSRIPLVDFTQQEKDLLSNYALEAYDASYNNRDISSFICSIDYLVYRASKISKETIKYINDFKSNLIKNT